MASDERGTPVHTKSLPLPLPLPPPLSFTRALFVFLVLLEPSPLSLSLSLSPALSLCLSLSLSLSSRSSSASYPSRSPRSGRIGHTPPLGRSYELTEVSSRAVPNNSALAGVSGTCATEVPGLGTSAVERDRHTSIDLHLKMAKAKARISP